MAANNTQSIQGIAYTFIRYYENFSEVYILSFFLRSLRCAEKQIKFNVQFLWIINSSLNTE